MQYQRSHIIAILTVLCIATLPQIIFIAISGHIIAILKAYVIAIVKPVRIQWKFNCRSTTYLNFQLLCWLQDYLLLSSIYFTKERLSSTEFGNEQVNLLPIIILINMPVDAFVMLRFVCLLLLFIENAFASCVGTFVYMYSVWLV